MAVDGLTLRVTGDVFILPDQFGRRRPLANADVTLRAFASTPTGLKQIVAPTNPVQATTDAHGHFDQRTDWGTIVGGRVQALPEPEAFDAEVTDPDSGTIVQVGRVVGDGDGLFLEPQIAAPSDPLAKVTGGREFTDIAEFARFLAAGLAAPDKLGEVKVSRLFVDPKDRLSPTAPEKLFRHFGVLLDRLQTLSREQRRRSPDFTPNHEDLFVPMGFKPLEKQIVATLAWHPRLSPAERVAKMVSSFGADVTEDVLRRHISRLVTMLGKILSMPIEYQPGWYLWEDMAVILTLFTGIGLVAQRNRIVWADFLNNADGRELTLSTL